MGFLVVSSYSLALVAIYIRLAKDYLLLLKVKDKEDLAEGDLGVPPFRVIAA
jgi:hypothetical protein